jgi:hypothetical protein
MRSVSEGLKSEVHLWLVRAGVYADDPAGRALEHRADEITGGATDLPQYRSSSASKPRPLPDVRSAATYFQHRVEDQIDNYYSPRAVKLQRRLRTFRRLQSALAVLAAILGGVAAATGADLGAWIAVMTTIGTALAVHVAAQRNRRHVRSGVPVLP